MAPLTRVRANAEHVPQPIMAQYYKQRAVEPGTLLITEATFISPAAGGMGNVPGIYNQAQIDGWKRVTQDVHENGSKIFMQLWALGRAASAETLKKELGTDGKVVSASDLAFEGGDKPTPLTEAEIDEYVKTYAQAAKNAIEAGFDGVEIHGANGYLLDQFLQDVSNKRTDKYGGSIENRARFPLAVAKAVVEAVGAEKVGYRISPYSPFQGMKMEDPKPTFEYLIKGLKELKLVYLHVTESRVTGNADVEGVEHIEPLVNLWTEDGSVALVAGGYKPDSARRAVDETYTGKNVLVVFGRWFISNPDLVFRLKNEVELIKYDRDTFYTPEKAQGYTDYEFSKEFLATQKKVAA